MTQFTITEPLVLAKGKHVAGQGYGCAMEVLSWTLGEQFTDFPASVDTRLARMVQWWNDKAGRIRGTIDYEADQLVLSPADAIRAFELATLTIGTAPRPIDGRNFFPVSLRDDSGRGAHGLISSRFHQIAVRESLEAAADYIEQIIRNFREDAGLDEVSTPTPQQVDSALARIRERV